MTHGELPGHAAAHGVSGDREGRQSEFCRESIHEIRQAGAAQLKSLRRTRQTMSRKVRNDDVKPRLQRRHPAIPAGVRVAESVQQHQQRSVRITVVAVVHMKAARRSTKCEASLV